MTNALVYANLCFVFETFGRYTQKGIHKMRKTVPFKIVLLFTIFIMLLTGCMFVSTTAERAADA